MYEVILYEDAHGYCPVKGLVDELDQKAESDKNARVQLKQMLFQVDLLESIGTWGKGDHVEHLQSDIWELRPGSNRILFFAWRENTFVLLHSFRKTTRKTPQREIDKALRELNDWISRHGK